MPRPVGSKNKPKIEVSDTWECPSCGLRQITMVGVKEVAHHCPKRDAQPAPAKGHKKLPLIVNFALIQVPDQRLCATLSARTPATVKNGPGRPKGSRNRPKASEAILGASCEH